jgi:translocation and assembly module TamA
MSRHSLLFLLLLLCCGAHAQMRVEIKGTPDFIAENIRNHIGSVSDIERARPRLLEKKLIVSIRDATQALGYYETTFQHQIKDDTLRITIDLGPPVVWAAPQIELIGAVATLKPATKMTQAPPFIIGATINHATYETFKRELLETCQQNGFLDAHYAVSRLVVDVEQHRATAKSTAANVIALAQWSLAAVNSMLTCYGVYRQSNRGIFTTKRC